MTDPPEPNGVRSVLVVDDDPFIRRLIVTTLEDIAGFAISIDAGASLRRQSNAATSFSGTSAVTHTVLKSAMLIIGCVGSLIMLPGVTASAVMLPPTGAVIVSRRDGGLLPRGIPRIFKRACVRVYSAAACAWSLLA